MTQRLLLAGRTALVTGGADGIGLAIAERFIQEGATVWLADINELKGHREAERMNRGLPEGSAGRAYCVRCDTASDDSVQQAVHEAQRESGGIDILVNNAAVAISGHAATMAVGDWDRVININLTGYWRTIRAVLPGMLQRKRGVIVNMSSTQAHRSWPDWTAYAAAKGGVLSMTRQLAGQFADQGIRVNSISPGAIDTPMNEKRVAEEGEQLRAQWAYMHAMKRTGKPQEVASTVVFLASDESSFITGQDLLVDGGLSTLSRYKD
ncbi:MAG: SDR family oxidoreductase [Verrucomicrobia bacterium]|nr:SDR family oxidoreductase [Verrucomicrobiota bacterium]